MGVTSTRHKRDVANREKALKGFTLESITTEPNTAAAIWKAPRPYVKEIHVLLKASARGRDLQGSSPEQRLEGTISTIFFQFLLSLLSACHLHALHLLCSRAPTGELLLESGVSIWGDATQGMPLNFLAQEAGGGGGVHPGFHGAVTDSSWQTPPQPPHLPTAPWHCTDSTQKHTTSLSEKRPIC